MNKMLLFVVFVLSIRTDESNTFAYKRLEKGRAAGIYATRQRCQMGQNVHQSGAGELDDPQVRRVARAGIFQTLS